MARAVKWLCVILVGAFCVGAGMAAVKEGERIKAERAGHGLGNRIR